MPKALKITSDSVEEIEVSNDGAFIQDEEYQSHKRPWDSHCLSMCERWKHRQFRLSMVCWDMFHPEEDAENILATYVYRRLKHYSGCIPGGGDAGGRPDDLMYGPVYITNEDTDGIVDITKEDLRYILEQLNEYPISSRELIFHLFLIEVIEKRFPDLMPSEGEPLLF